MAGVKPPIFSSIIPSKPHGTPVPYRARLTRAGVKRDWSAYVADLPRVDDLSIPLDVAVDPDWTGQMVEMADYIGPYWTLLLVDRFGGQRPYIPLSPLDSPFVTVVSAQACARLAHFFGGARFWIPTGKVHVFRAKGAPVVAAVRAGHLTVSQAAVILRSSRSYVAHLVNQTRMGIGVAPLVIPEPREVVLLKRAAEAVEAELTGAGVDPDAVDAAIGAILTVAEPLPPSGPAIPAISYEEEPFHD